jgi:O-acetylhomoserine (thiol)-lyase
MVFGVKGGFDPVVKFYDSLKLLMPLVHRGDAMSLSCHPASTLHRQMSTGKKRAAGASPEMIRLSIGIEQVDDIIVDLDGALDTTI